MTKVAIKLLALKGALRAMHDTQEAYNFGEIELDTDVAYFLSKEINECESRIRVLTLHCQG